MLPLADQLATLDAGDPSYASDFVDCLLTSAVSQGCSDIHLQPEASGLVIRWRMDGVLQHVGTFSAGEKADIVTRLKVLAGLLTYQTDVPQEGRLRKSVGGIEMRVSTIPTVFGERAVVRMFGARENLTELQQLGMPSDTLSELHRILSETSGALLITGPAGSGKTTTAYACLRELVSQNAGGRNLVSLEDPVEVVLEGVSQSQSNAAAGFDIMTGLKSILRQDPEFIFIGEIRDRDTAAVALQAALTGQLVISTFHAGSSAEAVSRLIEMDIEPYVLRSVLRGIISQRLVRRLCSCGKTTSDPERLLGLPLPTATIAAGCDACSQTGYQGRMMTAELLSAQQSSIGAAILDRQDTASIERLAADGGMKSLWERGLSLVQSGQTSPQEIRRVLGWRERQS